MRFARLFAPLTASLAWLAPAAYGAPSPGDLATVANYLSAYVHVLKHPVIVYNWSNAPGTASLPTQSADPANFKAIQSSSRIYWNQNQNGDTENDYGLGLYAALDPATTRQFGSASNWVLTQITLPSGFRVFDAGVSGDLFAASPPNAVYQALSRMGCPFDSGDEPDPMTLTADIMNPNKYSGNPGCAYVLREIMQGKLSIDSFIYPYGSSNLRACGAAAPGSTNHQLRNSAFVITSGSKIEPAAVRTYSRLTTDDLENRIRIQSLFYKAQAQASYPAEISVKTPPVVVSGAPGMLWPGLDGQKTSSNLDDWIKRNLFGCASDPTYQMSESTADPARCAGLNGPESAATRFAGVIGKITQPFLMPQANF